MWRKWLWEVTERAPLGPNAYLLNFSLVYLKCVKAYLTYFEKYKVYLNPWINTMWSFLFNYTAVNEIHRVGINYVNYTADAEEGRFPVQGILGKETIVNMAAIAGRVLSFSKNAKVLVSPMRVSTVPAHRYSIEVSSTGEQITHTGQVS